MVYGEGDGESQNVLEEGWNMTKKRFRKVNTAEHRKMERRRDWQGRARLFEYDPHLRWEQ